MRSTSTARDGRRLVTTDENGKLTGELYTREPQPGGTVALTLDIDLQAVAEQTLASTIQGMMDKDSYQRGGAAVVMGVGNGEVLAMASYPTYDLETFNRDYETLAEDDRLPMFNRATQGIYAPRLDLQAVYLRGGAGERRHHPYHHHRGSGACIPIIKIPSPRAGSGGRPA